MATNYFTLLTKIGQASIANAIALGQKVNLTEMAIGDGKGNPTVPKESQISLINEVYRAQVNQLMTDPDNPNYLIAEMIVPTNVGGWSVREVGLFDDAKNLIAIANFPETYKPKLEEGSGRDLVIRIILQVQSIDAITLKIDPTVILASQAWVKENFTRAILLPGGSTGQILAKKSDANGDIEWKDIDIPEQTNADWNATEGPAEILNKPDLLSQVYPVGSIYMSVTAIDPAILFGGVWEQIQDRFLLACGSSFSAGSSGGEASHVLSIEEMPGHSHSATAWTDSQGDHNHNMTLNRYCGDGSVTSYAGWGADRVQAAAATNYTSTEGAHAHNVEVSIGSTGGNIAHNNMPPYLAVYIWKRTA